MRVAVAGGTGLIGRMIVEVLRERGDEPVVLARSTGVDLVAGTGLDGVLTAVESVIDVTNIVTTSARKAIPFFEAVSTNLLAAERSAGVQHHVALSIIGSDRVKFGYYLGKRRQEEVILTGRVPSTILRTTQFHEFASQVLASTGSFVMVPKMLCQPVSAHEVASALVDLAHGPARDHAPELAGPQQEHMVDMVRALAVQRGDTRRVLGLKLPGAAGKGMTSGELLPKRDGPRGQVTFAQWLASADSAP